MLVVFFFACMPHEFIHDEISGHKDTIDYHHKHTQVSHHHIHCKFLQEVLAPYVAGNFQKLQVSEISFSVLAKTPLPFFSAERLFYNTLRGPPAKF